MATHNTYLPDDLSERAREADLNLSRLLRQAVEEQLERISAMTTIQSDEYIVGIVGEDGDYFDGRITGELVYDLDGVYSYYLTNDGRLLGYDETHQTITRDLLSEPGFTLADIGDPEARVAIGKRLGLRVIIDL